MKMIATALISLFAVAAMADHHEKGAATTPADTTAAPTATASHEADHGKMAKAPTEEECKTNKKLMNTEACKKPMMKSKK